MRHSSSCSPLARMQTHSRRDRRPIRCLSPQRRVRTQAADCRDAASSALITTPKRRWTAETPPEDRPWDPPSRLHLLMMSPANTKITTPHHHRMRIRTRAGQRDSESRTSARRTGSRRAMLCPTGISRTRQPGSCRNRWVRSRNGLPGQSPPLMNVRPSAPLGLAFRLID